MEKYVVFQRTAQNDIESYLNQVFGRYGYDVDKAAAHFQSLLCIPVSPGDVDLIHTCEALAEEGNAYSGRTPRASLHRTRTQCFRDVLIEMRADTERELNEAVCRLEAAGIAHEDAVRQTLARSINVMALRKDITKVGCTTCMERSGPLTYRKNSSVIKVAANTAYVIGLIGLICLAIYTHSDSAGLLAVGTMSLGYFLLTIASTYYRPHRPISGPLQAEIDRLVSKGHFSDVSDLQRIRWAAFKERYPSSGKPIFTWLVIFAVIATTIVGCCMNRDHTLGGVFAIVCGWTGSYLGQRIWKRRDDLLKLRMSSS